MSTDSGEIPDNSIDGQKLEDIEIPDDINGDYLERESYREIYVLSSVASLQKENGYANGAEIQEDLDSRLNVSWGNGTVYPILHDLFHEGYLDRHETRRKKNYFITEEGVDQLEDSLDEFLDLAMSLGKICSSLDGEKPNRLDELELLRQQL